MIELKIPEVGESVQEALLAQWLKRDGESVRKDDVLFVIETDKVTLEISAPADGVLRILVPEGQTVKVGAVVGQIEETAAEKRAEECKKTARTGGKSPSGRDARPAGPERRPPTFSTARRRGRCASDRKSRRPPSRSSPHRSALWRRKRESTFPPLRRQAPEEELPRETSCFSLSSMRLKNRPHRRQSGNTPVPYLLRKKGHTLPREEIIRKPMSPIRQRIAARLLDARQNTAMLTTFNEIDMSRVQALRKQFGEEFRQKHGIRLGLMSFFLKASVAALKEMPEVNAFIEGNEIVYHNYYHIGVAIGAERGLVVPVIRNADRLGFAALERAIADFAKKVEENRLDISDLEGGTFTITNGGVFGSLLSTPILNPPQSAILGMHKIEDRPVVVAQQIVIRPMMYVALSYDHRIIDGREAVTFLRKDQGLRRKSRPHHDGDITLQGDVDA